MKAAVSSIGLAALVAAASAGAATVTSISPTLARVDAGQTFTVTGTGLANLSIENCVPEGAPTGNATQVVFSCKPQVPGVQRLLVAGVPSGHQVQVHHPVRTGNPAAQGLPSHGGVSLFNGNFHHQVVDFSVPTRGMPMVLSRSYNSYDWGGTANDKPPYRGAVDACRPWRFNWELNAGYVPNSNQQQIYVEQADGSGKTWARTAGGSWVAMDPGNFDVLTIDTNGLRVSRRDGTVQTFEQPAGQSKWRLRTLQDVHKKGFTVDYGGNGRVSRVTDAGGGVSTFTWDTFGRLTTVTRPAISASAPIVLTYEWEGGSQSAPAPCSDSPTAETRYPARLVSVTDNLMGNDHPRTTRYSYVTLLGDGRRMLQSITDATNKTLASLTWQSKVYGNVGVDALSNGVGDTWRFEYQSCNAVNAQGVPEQCLTVNPDLRKAQAFKVIATPPQGPARTAYFDVAGRPAGGEDGLGRRSAMKSKAVNDVLSSDNYRQAALPVISQSPLAVQGQYDTRFQYDSNGLREAITDAEQNVRRQGWAQAASATNVFCTTEDRSAEGLIRKASRDALCRLIGQAEPGRPASALLYENSTVPNRPTAIVGPRQDRTTLRYNAIGLVDRTEGPMGEVTTTVYDRIGRVTRSVNPLLGATDTTYVGLSNLPDTITDPVGRKTRHTYDAAGRLASRTIPSGHVTHYTYDGAGRLTQTTTIVDGQTISQRTEYDALGRVARTIDGNNNASNTWFDAAGNVQRRANALDQATTYVYDDDNRVVQMTDPMGRVTSTVYDKLGRTRSVTTAAGTQSYSYDADGRVTEHVDARGLRTRYAYHPTQGHLEAVTDALGNTTRAEVDAAGNTTAITDPRGQTTRFEFDKSNRRTKRIDPNGHIWKWTYDAAGNVRFAEAPGGLITEHVYDVAGQLTKTVLPGGGTISYVYDPNGNRERMVDATGETRYVWDGVNRLKTVTDPRGKTVGYAYDPAGNRTAITYPHGKVVGYGFDAANRLVSVTDWTGKTHRYTLNAAGQVTDLLLGNGTRTGMTYDGAGRLQVLANAGVGGSTISFHSLTMDGNGNIAEANNTLPLLPSFGNATKTMTYDAANRLASVDGQSVTHDDAGRLTSIGNDAYAYDGRDLLTTITGPNAAAYTYNGAGHRVAKTVGGTTTRYVIDPTGGDLFSVLAETDGAGTLQRSYIHGYGLLLQLSATDVPRYYHYDPTGHTLALTDGSGAVTDRYAYTPYGETTASGASVNPFRFVGKFGVMDEGGGLHYMRARYGLMSLGSFLGLDSVDELSGGVRGRNRYAYAAANPLLYIDPNGKDEKRSNESESMASRFLLVSSASVTFLGTQMEVASKALKIPTSLVVENINKYGDGAFLFAGLAVSGVQNSTGENGDGRFVRDAITGTVSTISTMGLSVPIGAACAAVATGSVAGAPLAVLVCPIVAVGTQQVVGYVAEHTYDWVENKTGLFSSYINWASGIGESFYDFSQKPEVQNAKNGNCQSARSDPDWLSRKLQSLIWCN